MASLTGDRETLRRLCDRLRARPDQVLTRSRPELDGDSVAAAVHRLCAWAAAEMRIGEPVPRLHPLASGDQLEVVGREFLAWTDASPEQIERWRAQVQAIGRAT